MPLGRGQPCGVGRVPEGTPADVELLGEGQSRCWRPWAASLCRTSPAVGGHRGSRSCRSRNFSSQILFQFGECADLAYKMLNALQNPMHVAFRKALFVDMEVPQGLGWYHCVIPSFMSSSTLARWIGMPACSPTNA